jgi:hypothetical protein
MSLAPPYWLPAPEAFRSPRYSDHAPRVWGVFCEMTSGNGGEMEGIKIQEVHCLSVNSQNKSASHTSTFSSPPRKSYEGKSPPGQQ